MTWFTPIATYAAINDSIRTFRIEELPPQQTLQAETLAERAQRVVTIYRPLILLLMAFSNFPLIRPSWRALVTMFLQALDHLAAGVPPAPPMPAAATAAADTDPLPTTPDFKAGKDL